MTSTDSTRQHPADYEVMVLLMDDQPMVGEAVRRMLADEKTIDFHYCADPQQALAVATQLRPTVILQDLVMPGVDGLDLVRAYREQPLLSDVPIIVLSTREDPSVKSAAFAAGANDYLVKLPDPIELIARLRYHSRAYLALRQRDEANRALRRSQQQLQETNLILQQLIQSDGLTGLYNRRHFDEYLENEWRRAQRDQTELSLMLIDVDFFKAFNDHFGHTAGDDALRQVAKALRQTCNRAADLVARYGGEEFVVVLPNTSSGNAHLLAEKVRRAVELLAIPHIKPEPSAPLTISVGVATLRVAMGQLDPIMLVDLADQALYKAKLSGRNRIEVTRPEPY